MSPLHTGPPIHVLLVEDDPADAELAHIHLDEGSERQFRVTRTTTLRAAIERLSNPSQVVDVVLLDLSLPDSQGTDTLAQIRLHGEQAAVVVMSGSLDDRLSLEAASLGADAYLAKEEAEGPLLVRTILYALHQHDARRELEREKLASDYRATHDPLTRLPNRALFMDRLDQALRSAERTRKCVGLLFIDLDGFKAINDTLGHAAGDALLRAAAERLSASVRASDTVARLGGDEFVVLLTNVSQRDDVFTLARELESVLAEPLELLGPGIRPGASIGCAVAPEHARTASELIGAADAAMYDTKRTRRALAKAPSATGGSVGHQAAAAPSSMRAPAFASARGAPAQDAALLDALELAYTPRFDVANGCLHALAVEPVSRAETGGVGGDAAPCPRGSEHPSLRGVPPEAWLGAIFEHLAADLARSPELRAAPRLSLELPGPLALHPSVRSHVDALRATLRLTGGDGAGAELLEWVLPAELATPTPRASAPQAAAQTRPSGADGVPDASVAELICWALAARVGIALRFSDDPTLDQLLRVARTFDRARIHVHVRQLGRGDADGADDLFAECFAHLVRRARMELTVEGIRTAREAERSHRLGAHALGGPLFGEALAAAELPRVSLDTCPWHPKDPPI